MSPSYNEYVIAMYVDGQTFSGIGKSLGLTIGQVAGVVHRAALKGRLVKRKPRKPRLYDPVSVVAAVFGPTPLLQAGPRHCRAIIEGRGEHAVVCGQATVVGTSWCAMHKSIVFVPVEVRKVRRAA